MRQGSSLARRFSSLSEELLQAHRQHSFDPSLVKDTKDFQIIQNWDLPLFNLNYKPKEYLPPSPSLLHKVRQHLFDWTNRQQTDLFQAFLQELSRNTLQKDSLAVLCENNLFQRVLLFRRQMDKYGFQLEIELEGATMHSTILNIQQVKGLFLDRHLNLPQDEYQLLKGDKEHTYTLKKKETRQKKLKRALQQEERVAPEAVFYDQLLLHDLANLSLYRKSYQVVQETLLVEHDVQLRIREKKSGRVVYGAEERRWLHSYLQVEKRVNAFEDTAYCLADLDFALLRNPLLRP